MAKVRVYELARELNMESKKLVEKLTACGMNIKNYMSTLDEEAVVRAKEIVSGAVSEVIEERRIKPRIIRRRKKIIRVDKKPSAKKAVKKAEEEVEFDYYVCKVCGNTVENKAPKKCPICGAPLEQFEKII